MTKDNKIIDLKKKNHHQESMVLALKQLRHGEPCIQMPKIRQTVMNVVNWGLNKVPSEYLRVERVTLLWSRGKVGSRIPSSMDTLSEKLIPCRRVIIKEGPSAARERQVTVCGRVVVML